MKTKSQIEARLKCAEPCLDNPTSPETFRHSIGFVEALEWVLRESNAKNECASAGDALSVMAISLRKTVRELQNVIDKLERP